MNNRRVGSIACLSLAALLIAGCGGSGASEPAPLGPSNAVPSDSASSAVDDPLASMAAGEGESSSGLLPIVPGVAGSSSGAIPGESSSPSTIAPSGTVPQTGEAPSGTTGVSTDVDVLTDPSTQTTRYIWGPVTIYQMTGNNPPVVQIAKNPTVKNQVTVKTLATSALGGKKTTGSNDVLLVNYASTSLKQGTPLASTWNEGATATVRVGSLPAGWVKGFKGMQVGERRLLLIPADQATGKPGSGMPEVSPGDTLVAVVDLIDVVAVPTASAQPSAQNVLPSIAPNPNPIVTQAPTVAPIPSPTPTVQAPVPTPNPGVSTPPTPVASTPPPSSFQALPVSMFGLHVPWALPANYPVNGSESVQWDGQWPSVNFGTIRLWDTRTTWAMLEPAKGQFTWNILDGQVAQAKQNGINDYVMVLGGTPEWAISAPAPGSAWWIGPNAASPPMNDQDWIDYVTAVATRYQGTIRSYQIWNEPNSKLFWQGTPEQMAHLIFLANKTIKKIDPQAKIIAPGPVSSEFVSPNAGKKWWKAMAAVNWPVDAVAMNVYPSPNQGVKVFTSMVKTGVKAVKSTGWTGPIWLTEASYLDRTGAEIPAQEQRELVARSYWAAWDAGITRMYWYAWEPSYTLDPSQRLLLLQSGSPGAEGYQDAYNAGRSTTP